MWYGLSIRRAIYRYPNIACELLTSDVPQILDKLVENNTYTKPPSS